MTTPKEVFTFIRDEKGCDGKGYLEINRFICRGIEYLFYKWGLIDFDLMQKCIELMNKNKPQNDSFTEYKYWYGGNSWWSIFKVSGDNELKELFAEKRRFLTHLIEKL
jgi:hypothetical protein